MFSRIPAPFTGLHGPGRPFRAGRACIAAIALASTLSTPAVAKTIDWSGYTWEVRDGGGGPGPNNWSADNVSVDRQKRLHLKIAKRDGKWSCAELTMTKALGFGRYEFDVDSPAEFMNDNIVLGLFNYPTRDIGPDGTNEIDIEYATWGGQQKEHGNWTVWPAVIGVEHGSSQFVPTCETAGSVNTFYWTQDYVSFDWKPVYEGLAGMPCASLHWSYHPADVNKSIPQHPLPVHINLWLFNGKPPTDDKEVEIIVSAFRYGAAS